MIPLNSLAGLCSRFGHSQLLARVDQTDLLNIDALFLFESLLYIEDGVLSLKVEAQLAAKQRPDLHSLTPQAKARQQLKPHAAQASMP